MSTNTKWRMMLQSSLAVCACGTTFQVAGCLSQLGQNFNPCGTVLNCDPTDFDALFLDAPDFEFNPTCTIPTLWNCGGPISNVTGANAAAGTGTTGTTTTTTTTTGTTGTNRGTGLLGGTTGVSGRGGNTGGGFGF
ncbi:MAG: hypothetical protein HRF43_08735 [Phycisphaerae bacterium]|jgi:hypothetical protein